MIARPSFIFGAEKRRLESISSGKCMYAPVCKIGCQGIPVAKFCPDCDSVLQREAAWRSVERCVQVLLQLFASRAPQNSRHR